MHRSECSARRVFLLQSFQATVQGYLGCGTHAVDEQNSVEVIDLVLECAREQSTRFDLHRRAFEGLGADNH